MTGVLHETISLPPVAAATKRGRDRGSEESGPNSTVAFSSLPLLLPPVDAICHKDDRDPE